MESKYDFKDYKSISLYVINYLLNNYKNERQMFFLFAFIYLISVMFFSDLLIYQEIGFTTQSFLNFLFYNYELKDSFRSLSLLLIFGIIFLIYYYFLNNAINYSLKDLYRSTINNHIIKTKTFFKFLYTNVLIMGYYILIFFIPFIFYYFDYTPNIIIGIVFLTIINTLFLSVLYQKLLRINNNLFNYPENLIKSILKKNYFILMLSSIIVSPFLLMVLFSFISVIFEIHLLSFVFSIYLASILLSILVILMFFDLILQKILNEKLNIAPLTRRNNTQYKYKLLGIIILICGTLYSININTKTFIEQISQNKPNKALSISFNFIFNIGLIDTTKKNKQLFTKNKNNEFIIIPKNTHEVLSKNIQISKNRFIYFVKEKSSNQLQVFYAENQNNKLNLIENTIKTLNK